MSNYFENKELFLEPTTKQYGNHMVMTNVHKTTKTKYINIDTRFRDEYNSTNITNYVITLPERITDVNTLTIKNIEMPMSMYNISNSLGNNFFKVTDISYNNIAQTIIIPDGNYSSSNIQATINNAILNSKIDTAHINDLSFSYINNRGNFYTNNASFKIEFDTVIDISGGFDKYNFKSKLGWMLGYRKTTYNITTNNSNALSESLIDLNGPRYLYLAIDEFKRGNQNSFVSPLAGSIINKNIIARVSIDNKTYPFGSILIANDGGGLLTSDIRSYTGKIDIQKLNVQLLNELGVPVNLNGLDFSFCIEVEHEA